MPHIALYNHAKWTDSQRPLQEKPKTLKIRHLIAYNAGIKNFKSSLAQTKRPIFLYICAKIGKILGAVLEKMPENLEERTLNPL